MENCEASKGFGYIYIYIYRLLEKMFHNLKKKLFLHYILLLGF